MLNNVEVRLQCVKYLLNFHSRAGLYLIVKTILSNPCGPLKLSSDCHRWKFKTNTEW